MKNLLEIILLFLKLGTIAFGGPAAHIAMMEDEVVTKRKWMSHQHFLDLIGATNLIPGPNSTEMAIHCGFMRGGYPGLILAGISFIFPAVVITLLFAYIYVQYGDLPEVEPFFYGIKPVVLVIILNAVYKLGKKAVKGWKLLLIGLLVVIINLSGLNEIFSIFVGGILGALFIILTEKKDKLFSFFSFNFFSFLTSLLLLDYSNKNEISITKLFLIFLKIGAVLFGSGYVLIAYIDGELVQGVNWLSRQQLLDAIAVGQFTPGPVLSTATFIGYIIAGLPGALASTFAIFLPSFLFVLLVNPIIPKLRRSYFFSYFLDAVNVSALAVMLVIVFKIGSEVLIDWKLLLIAAANIVIIVVVKKINMFYLILGSAAAGYLFYYFSL